MSYLTPNAEEFGYPGAHNKAYTDDPLDPVYHYTTYMGDVDSRSFRSEYVMPKPQREHPKYKYKKPSKNRKKQVTIASILFILFFLAISATCILFIYFLVNEDTTNGTKVPPLVVGVSVDAQLSLKQPFLVEYDDPSSKAYQDLEMEFTKAMDEIMLASNYSSTYIGTTVLDFRNGSTVVGFNLDFNDIPPHLDKDVGSEELKGELHQDIADVINDAVTDPNSTINSDLNAKEESVMINDVRVDIQPVTTSETITTKPSLTTKQTTTTSTETTSKLTTTIPETNMPTTRPSNEFQTTLVTTQREATTQMAYTTFKEELTTKETATESPVMTTLLIQEEITEATSMQGLTTDVQTTNIDAITTEHMMDQTTLGGSTIVVYTTTVEEQQHTTELEEETTIVTILQTTEQPTTAQPTTEKSVQLSTEQLTTVTTEVATETTKQLTTEQLATELLTTLLITEQYTTMDSSTGQDISPIGDLTEFPSNSSATIHVFGSMVLNVSYPESLNNKSSTDYIDLASAAGIGIDCSLLHTELEPVYAGNDITEFKPGSTSIIIMFTMYLTDVPAAYYNETNGLSTSEYISSSVEFVLTDSIERGVFGNLDILKDSVTVIEVINSKEDTYTCQNISSLCCKNLPYHSAVFPNSLAISHDEAENIMNVFSGSCYTDAALYLCSKVYPECPSDVTPQLLPCRSFCEDVTSGVNSGVLLEVQNNTGVQISNCSYLNEPSQDRPCFTSDGQILTRSAAAYNEEICSTRPLHPPPSARIVGGRSAELGEWPWMISLQRFTSHQCGAVLIAPQYALTAAHCLGLANTAELGTISLSSKSQPEQRVGIETTFAHPEYNPLTLQNDIAILKLDKQVEYTDYVRPVCVSTNTSQFQVGENCYITGWGDTVGNGNLPDVLQEVSLPLVDINTCATRYASVGITIDESVVCAGFAEGGKDSCQGDSGGPLVCQNSAGLWNLYGVVSNGIECALPNSPGVYSRVPAFMDFIDLVLSGGTPLYRLCTQEEFMCSNGACVNKDWQCDDHNDCRDNSDELNCGCSDDEYTCNMGDCVFDAWVCDGDYDCLDGSDEQNCGCLPNQFECGDGVCIVASYFCDDYQDCRNGKDEENCPDDVTEVPAMCSDNKFMCDNGVCIEANYECDKDSDCEDGSDEANCPELTDAPVIPAQCYNITSEICDDILISHKALFPNTYARTPEDAEELLVQFNAESSCHQDSMRLVCSLVYQGCEDDAAAPVHPCDALCQSVLSTCAESFQAVTLTNNLFQITCVALQDTDCLSAPGYCDDFLCTNNHCIQDDYHCDDYIDCSDESDESVSTCEATGSPSHLCHPTNNTLCNDYLPYTYAAFPNDYAQTVEIADQVISRLIPSAYCHEDMMLLMCNLLFPECDGYDYEPCMDHCIEVASSCPDAFTTLRNELNITSPISCDGLPETNCLSSDGLCSDEDYQCADGKCIPFELTCDSHADCLDNTDESNCSCTDDQYICSDTGTCLASYQVCDGIENCPNAEDETPCDDGCPGDFFRCANETSCIPMAYVCDGYSDCVELNDEHGCTICGQFEFACKDDGYCLPSYYVCDGHDNCYDGSDEMECGK